MRELFLILRGRWLLLTTTTTLGLAVSLATTLLWPNSYRTAGTLGAEMVSQPDKGGAALTAGLDALFSVPDCAHKFSRTFFSELNKGASAGGDDGAAAKAAIGYLATELSAGSLKHQNPEDAMAAFLVGPFRQRATFPDSGFAYKISGSRADEYRIDFQATMAGVGGPVVRATAPALYASIECFREVQVAQLRNAREKITKQQAGVLIGDSSFGSILRIFHAKEVALRIRLFEITSRIDRVEGRPAHRQGEPPLQESGAVLSDFSAQLQWHEWVELDRLIGRVVALGRASTSEDKVLKEIVDDITALKVDRDELRERERTVLKAFRASYMPESINEISLLTNGSGPGLPLPKVGEEAFPPWRELEVTTVVHQNPWYTVFVGVALGAAFGALIALSMPAIVNARRQSPVEG